MKQAHPDSLVLALDTTGPRCSVALARGERILAHSSEPMRRGHAERLAPMVVEIMHAAGVAPGDIDRLAVCTGPGSFTGLRVALSYAKGFALPRALPVLGFSSLAVARAPNPDALVLVDVRRGEVMAHSARLAPTVMSAEAARALAAAHGGPVLRDPELDIGLLARLAGRADPAAHPAVPLYARAPDAKLPGGKALPAP